MRFVKNAWYVATLSSNAVGKSWDGWVAGEPVLLYRTQDDDLVALENRCAHRHLPLSLGLWEGDNIRCRYHGFLYNSSGRCIELPGESQIPSVMRVRKYPAVDLHGLIWLWPGDPDLADEALIPSYAGTGESDYAQNMVELEVDAPALNLIDNLMDLNHLCFTHRLLGASHPVHDAEMRTEAQGDAIVYTRELDRPDGLMLQYVMRYHAPGIVNATLTPYDRKTGERAAGFSSDTLHCLTPISEARTRYIVLRSCNGQVSDWQSALDKLSVREAIEITLDEDKTIVEAMMRMKEASGEDLPLERLVAADSASVQARRLHQKLLDREQGKTKPVLQRGASL